MKLRLAILALFSAIPAIAADNYAAYSLYWELQQFAKPYNFMYSQAGAKEGNCFSTMADVTNYLAKSHPEYEVLQANTPYNAKSGVGLKSVTHPSLVLRNKQTGQTLVVVTERDHDKNWIGVEDVGVNPSEKKIIGTLMQWNRSPVVQFNNRVYADQVAWSLWNEPAAQGPCVKYNGTYMSFTLPFGNSAEVVATQEGKLYLVRRFQKSTELPLGIKGEIKSLGMLPAVNAAGAIGLDAVLGTIGNQTLTDSANLLLLLGSGNSITELKAGKELTDGLEVGVKTNVTLNPNNPLRGISRPNPYVEYVREDGSIAQRYYVDSQGNASAQFQRPGIVDQRFTLGYDGKNRELAWNYGVAKRFETFAIEASAGRGSAIGNLNLPSELARPSLATGRERSSNYFKLVASWDFGGPRQSSSPPLFERPTRQEFRPQWGVSRAPAEAALATTEAPPPEVHDLPAQYQPRATGEHASEPPVANDGCLARPGLRPNEPKKLPDAQPPRPASRVNLRGESYDAVEGD